VRRVFAAEGRVSKQGPDLAAATIAMGHRVADMASKAAKPTFWLLALALLAAMSASPALAARGHIYRKTIGWGVLNEAAELQSCTTHCKPGRAGSGKGQFNEPHGVAVNEASEDFYVVDKGNDRVERFNAQGEFLGQFDGSGSFEVEGVVKSGAKPPLGKLDQPETIAIDNACVSQKLKEQACKENDHSSGDVYVQDGFNHKVVDKFSPTGEYIGQLVFPEALNRVTITGVAVDRTGQLWVAVTEGAEFRRFYKFTNAITNPPGEPSFVEPKEAIFFEPGLAIDSTGNLYSGLSFEEPIDEVIAKFGPKGEVLKTALDEERSTDVAIELPSNEAFVDNVTKIRRFDLKEPPAEVENFGEGHLSSGIGMGLDSSSNEGQLYVADAANNDIVEFPLEEPGPPTVEHDSVTEVTANSADLQAEVNPRGATSEYHFEYGPCDSPNTCKESTYGKEVPVPEGVVGAPFDFEGHVVAAHPQDLQTGTTYHFRAVVHNERSNEGPTLGEEKVFATQPPGGTFALPDGRAWELVSPGQKRGALIQGISEGVIQAATSGEALTYTISSPSEPEPEGYANLVQVLARRTKGGWSTKDIALPHEVATGASVGTGSEYRFFSEDLSLAVIQPFGAFDPAISSEATEQTPYARMNFLNGNVEAPCTSSCYTPLVKSAPHPFGEEGNCPPLTLCGPRVVGANADGHEVIVATSIGLTENPEDNGGLYEWDDGSLTLISVLPNGKSAGSASGGLGSNGIVRHTISADGDRIVWSSAGHLYLREVAEEVTLELDHGLTGTPKFQTASADDAKVFFTDNGDLYVYYTEAEEAKRLSEGGEVQGGVAGASEDGSYLYFVANGKLTGGPGEEAIKGDCLGTASAGRSCNLYELHEEGGTWQTRLVAVLGGADFGDWGANVPDAVLPGLTARVSPNGQFLAFMSSQSLTGYDNRDANSAKPDQEVYEFDASEQASSTNPVCVSCNPTGARPVGAEYKQLAEGIAGGFQVWTANTWIAANVPAWTPYKNGAAFYQSRYLSNSGRLFFNSSDSLASQDVNGTEDVYQYELSGVGGEKGCSATLPSFSSRSGGCVSLISSGTSREESAFLDASESGADVFFLSSARLVKEDFDTALDIYDAHQCTPASPCISERTEAPRECSTESSCKAAPTPQPEVFGAPASATFSGLGNIIALTPPPSPTKLTNAQRLSKALKGCRSKHKGSKKRRKSCERQARRRYPVKATKKSVKAKSSAAARSAGMGGGR
jgi:DNA-binding beta-propeller fold protein YncE